MRVITVIVYKGIDKFANPYVGDRLDELNSLVKTLGWELVDSIEIKVREIVPGTYIPEGKIDELKEKSFLLGADAIIFYNDLSSRQIYNLSNRIDKKILTKVDIILMIFKDHAVSLEAKLQVELASLEVELPRLSGIGKAMEQIRGGIGLRGPGERETEIKKRHIKERIRTLKRKIEEIKKNRRLQLKERKNVFNACLVGYTNSGKSTIMNLLTKANVVEEDKLFSTLDTKTKRLFINGVFLTLTDTVGFIEDLPPQLIESFYSTLEVVKNANILLHVVDISYKFPEKRIEVVNEIIEDIFRRDNTEVPPMYYIFNKIDKIEDISVINRMAEKYFNGICISAKYSISVGKLHEILYNKAKEYYDKKSTLS
jgi:GTP-binding protein HflX